MTDQVAEPAQGAPLVIQQNLSNSETFDQLWDSGALDTAEEAAARAAQPKEPKAAKVEAPVEEPAAQVAAEGKELDAANAQEQAEQSGEEVPVVAKGADEDKAYASLDEFLADAKIDAESFRELPIEVKVGGEAKSIPLRDVIKGYQLEQHSQLKSLQLSEEKRGFEQEQTTVRTMLRQQADQSVALFKLAEDQLLADFKQINWQALEANDPGRAALLYNQFQARQTQISAHLQQLNTSRETEAKRAQEDHARTLPQEKEKLLQAVPEWKDPARFKVDRQSMLDYGKTRGFSDVELSTLTDHRFVQVLHDAARFRANQDAKPAVLNKVRTAPQMVKSGARQERNPQAVRSQQVKEAFYGRGARNDDVAAAYFDTLA